MKSLVVVRVVAVGVMLTSTWLCGMDRSARVDESCVEALICKEMAAKTSTLCLQHEASWGIAVAEYIATRPVGHKVVFSADNVNGYLVNKWLAAREMSSTMKVDARWCGLVTSIGKSMKGVTAPRHKDEPYFWPNIATAKTAWERREAFYPFAMYAISAWREEGLFAAIDEKGFVARWLVACQEMGTALVLPDALFGREEGFVRKGVRYGPSGEKVGGIHDLVASAVWSAGETEKDKVTECDAFLLEYVVYRLLTIMRKNEAGIASLRAMMQCVSRHMGFLRAGTLAIRCHFLRYAGLDSAPQSQDPDYQLPPRLCASASIETVVESLTPGTPVADGA